MAKSTLRRYKRPNLKGKSDLSLTKERIQALLREIVILRDGGCWLRHYPERAGTCGGRRKDGELVLQAEHLHTRANSASYADTRLVVCVCKRHHIYWKPQHSAEYNALAREFIGPKRADLWDRVRADYSPHKVDWKAAEVGLSAELQNTTFQP